MQIHANVIFDTRYFLDFHGRWITLFSCLRLTALVMFKNVYYNLPKSHPIFRNIRSTEADLSTSFRSILPFWSKRMAVPLNYCF